MGKVQIDESLFMLLCKYHLLELQDDEETIRAGLREKLDTVVLRKVYTRCKTSASPEERDRAFAEYLAKHK